MQKTPLVVLLAFLSASHKPTHTPREHHPPPVPFGPKVRSPFDRALRTPSPTLAHRLSLRPSYPLIALEAFFCPPKRHTPFLLIPDLSNRFYCPSTSSTNLHIKYTSYLIQNYDSDHWLSDSHLYWQKKKKETAQWTRLLLSLCLRWRRTFNLYPYLGLAKCPRMFESGKYSDLTIVAGNKRYPVHRALLASRSTFFDGVCSNPFRESETGVVDLTEDDPQAVEHMVHCKHVHAYTQDSANIR